jgi:hypothetical protein
VRTDIRKKKKLQEETATSNFIEVPRQRKDLSQATIKHTEIFLSTVSPSKDLLLPINFVTCFTKDSTITLLRNISGTVRFQDEFLLTLMV